MIVPVLAYAATVFVNVFLVSPVPTAYAATHALQIVQVEGSATMLLAVDRNVYVRQDAVG